MRGLDGLGRDVGIDAIYLHVFVHNPVAIRLYENSGFKVKSMDMEKGLDRSPENAHLP